MGELKSLFIESTAKSPEIDFNHLTGDLIISGKSIPENAAKIYEPLISWTNEYVNSPRKTTNLRLNLEYFNSASSIWIAKLIKTLTRIDREDFLLFIHLYFETENFDEMDEDELKDILGSLFDNIGETKVSVGIKTYGIDINGNIIRESTILI